MKVTKIDKTKMDVRTEAPAKYDIPDYTGRTHLDKALEAFLNQGSKHERFGHYFVDGAELSYRTCFMNRQSQAIMVEDIVAVRLESGDIVANSSVLQYVPKSNNITEAQTKLSLCVPMVPFSVFQEADMDINTLEIIERGPQESLVRKVYWKKDKKTGKDLFKDETVHFTGASLYRIGTETYLFDLDRRELDHKIFNPFLVKLPVSVDTIVDAYACLKPKEVLDAEAKGLEVLRQGEWFFIPLNDKPTLELIGSLKKSQCTEITLQAGHNRPNHAMGVHYDLKDSKVYGAKLPTFGWERAREISKFPCVVSFQVTHAGREHHPLQLGKIWWIAVPNTATDSFTITGDID